jgi:hypothetical protein
VDLKKIDGYKELSDDLHDYSRYHDEGGHDKVRIFGEKKKTEDIANLSAVVVEKPKADAPPVVLAGPDFEKKPKPVEQPKSDGKRESSEGGKASIDKGGRQRRRLEKPIASESDSKIADIPKATDKVAETQKATDKIAETAPTSAKK